jgi:hypothetical protein
MQTPIPPVGFETEIPSSEWPQTHALDGAATGTFSLKFRKEKVFTRVNFPSP